ncbi:flavodoxin FldB [Thaumasiovibrio sp. DFM-14]|uniref:flavodoxin FldB n=1 Tax=Thaumasiovibrio sp. DFM-14 TaxID=3384792 RepID=UPI0039A3260F
MKVGLFYGSSTCYTEMAAEKIRAQLGTGLVTLHNVKTAPLVLTQDYDLLIFGISTWDFGELQEDWAAAWSQLEQLDLSNKAIALFGLGDQEGYGEWFLDAMGLLHDALLDCEADIIGYWPTQGYQFEASKAITADSDFFVGLALDEDSQYDLSDERIAVWCEQIMQEYSQL